MVPLPLASAADGALAALHVLTPDGDLPASGAALLGERARMMNLTRNGQASPTGHCRLIDAAGGRIALNLAREDDWDLLLALLGAEANTWEEIAATARHTRANQLIQHGIGMGLPIALDDIVDPAPWLARERLGNRAERIGHSPLVVDLSSLWAGPLAGSLLANCGARVVKVESTHRPDGARAGNRPFFDLLNGGKRSVALDFRTEEGRRDLKRLLSAADIVIEASRPRAIRQLGIEAEILIAERPGKVWLRLLAHGEDEMRIGFGDDIGVAAGLPSVMEKAWGEPLMVGDALADPLAGLHGALATWASWRAGGGELLTLSMRDVVRQAMGDLGEVDLEHRAQEWARIADDCNEPPYPARKAYSAAEDLGHSTESVMSGLC